MTKVANSAELIHNGSSSMLWALKEEMMSTLEGS